MVKYKEFWFGLSLVALMIFYSLLLKTADDIGQYWVQLVHRYAQAKHVAVSDKAIYASQTHDSFILLGGSVAVFVMGLMGEIFLLKKRLQHGIKSRLPEIIFCLAIIPFLLVVGRGLLYLYRTGRLF
ncbi:hypothetical protein E4631_16380 [Hymenobacter sp. UV11]|uniref:hypothetical protein n=1 Tax=Hymenobacter sp. UV11 TaxID=1849735 RepID=UPI00105E58A1|nr:hypothetical protein [Hymenobacter sp. UV11]TDN37908.1 hypothetical protein A8B98_01215 [Hymenobacter sp. UV11]TFZ65119.1 hypothetical protein E4631_16380 [Hymenobacter sp. UV11]